MGSIVYIKLYARCLNVYRSPWPADHSWLHGGPAGDSRTNPDDDMYITGREPARNPHLVERYARTLMGELEVWWRAPRQIVEINKGKD